MNPWKFGQKQITIHKFTNSQSHNLQIHKVLGFHPNENQVQKMGWHGCGSTYMISNMVSSKKGSMICNTKYVVYHHNALLVAFHTGKAC